MARKVLVQLVDDLDGKEMGEDGATVSFGFDGVTYEIDLSGKNREAMEKAFGKYIESARKVSVKGRTAENRRTRNSGGGTVTPIRDRERTQAIRDWAKGQGLTVADRGRIPASVVEQYEAAQSPQAV